ncbi:DNA repair protein Rev1 [Anopheles darlingi]|uniref:DNA repair protein Rev1 n=1 Tax=Anopheles darlingi TaxID=43151 RepID=UPI0020FFFE09|nr:DNA repair protein Rev1 [Anopheles darlingi]XP_049541119.1 DNA repair protein Rev1 [Anopheles darlingi]XP_049541120.1 DNA repair protein Rev1 [Anopheles darlingi]XP_049541121.1 DNA repair protein Rev1 [Anopheles darlingi]
MKRKEKYESETGFEGWGDYMDAKIAKLEDQFRHTAANVAEPLSNLFAGISIFVNGYTDPSADELKRIMMQNGGVFHHYKRPTTTYTIASILPDVKVRAITSETIISPRWVVDCLKAGRILDYSRYLLYTQHKPSQPKLAFAAGTSSKARSTLPARPTDTDVAKPTLKRDNDPTDISRAECLNVLGLLKHFTDPEPSAAQDDSEEQVQNPQAAWVSNNAVSPATEDTTEPQAETVSPDVFQEPSSAKNETMTTPTKAPASSKQSLTATDPNFLTEFFNNSRLHHIATLGAGFKAYVAELREKSSRTFPARALLVESLPRHLEDRDSLGDNLPHLGIPARYIMHIDMDCFFVSVGLRKYPHLRGLPVAVTHSRGSEARVVPTHPGQNRALEIELYHKRLTERNKAPDIPIESRLSGIDEHNSLSEIASCSYEARRMGVKNGMFVGAALKLCPDLKTIPYDFEGYREVAYRLYDTIAQYTLDIEAVSCDEMFVDLTELLQSTGVSMTDFVRFVRDEISTETGCPCSAGIGSNRLQARMATKRAKPDGQFWLAPSDVESYMRDIPIGDLPGVGPSTTQRLKQMTYTTCADLQTIPRNVLQTEFGKKFGETLYNACRGIDERPLVYDKGRKSVSVDVNYGIRFTTEQEVDRFMRQLTEEIHRRLMELRQRGKLVTVKLLVRAPEAPVETAKFMGHGLCDVVTKSQPLANHTDDRSVIEAAVLGLMRTMAVPPHELRGIGIQISKFAEGKFKDGAAGNRLKTMMLAKAEQQKHQKDEERTGRTTRSEAEENYVVQGRLLQPDDDQQPSTSSAVPARDPPIMQPSSSYRSTPSKQAGSHSTHSNSVTNRVSPGRREIATTTSPSSRSKQTKPSTTLGRRRGRPPKGAGPVKQQSTSLPSTSTGGGLRKFLFRADNTKPVATAAASNTTSSTIENGSADHDLPAEIDPDVLAALPDDIRQEVIRDFRRQRQELLLLSSGKKNPPAEQKTPVKCSTTPVREIAKREWNTPKTPSPRGGYVGRESAVDGRIQVERKFLEALPFELRLEIEKQIALQRDSMVVVTTGNDYSDAEIDEPLRVTPEASPVKQLLPPTITESVPKDSNIFRRDNWRELVEEWIDSAEEPYEYDVELLAANGEELVENRALLERLYIIMRCIYRLVQQRGTCPWHRAYRAIERTVQTRMMVIYGSRLGIRSIQCEECNSHE